MPEQGPGPEVCPTFISLCFLSSQVNEESEKGTKKGDKEVDSPTMFSFSMVFCKRLENTNDS